LSLPEDFSDLPLNWLQLDIAGQCSSRNAGLKASSGDYILFLDDDDEIADDLIERHLVCLQQFDCDVSNGVVKERGAGELPENFKLLRMSDVFPTNNTMIRRELLHRSGLFDLAYDRGQRADGDLGMRVYLTGHLMVLNPCISLLHHHAPVGGLRTHGQRAVTRASSRKSLFHVNLATKSDLYLAKRYFTPRQVRELLWINLLSSFSVKGPWFRKLAKATIALLILPKTLNRLRRNSVDAGRMLQSFPQIDALQEEKTIAEM
jgi:glycosyltransferase involved in cell wall biosynthesis